jgi:hypothetical protein
MEPDNGRHAEIPPLPPNNPYKSEALCDIS